MWLSFSGALGFLFIFPVSLLKLMILLWYYLGMGIVCVGGGLPFPCFQGEPVGILTDQLFWFWALESFASGRRQEKRCALRITEGLGWETKGRGRAGMQFLTGGVSKSPAQALEP